METFDVIMTCCEAPDRVVHIVGWQSDVLVHLSCFKVFDQTQYFEYSL